MKKINGFLISLGVLAILFGGCKKKESDQKRLDSFPVRVSSVELRSLEDNLVVVGSLKAKAEATLYARVPGKLLRNLVKEGDAIQKGQAVALVERDEVGVKFEPAPVPSTLSGVVGRVYLDPGSDVLLNTPIALVADQSEMIGQADVPERYAPKIRSGQEVRIQVEAFSGKIFKGRVSRVSPVVDAMTRSAFVEVSIEDPSRLLRSGMFANLTIVMSAKKDILAVPLETVVEGTSPSVFVVSSGKANKRDSETGLKTDKFIEVKSGLSKGDQVVTFGLFGLKDGSAVELLDNGAEENAR